MAVQKLRGQRITSLWGWHYMASCHGLGARHGAFCLTSTLTVIPLQLMPITGQGLVCQGLKSKLIWLHSHSEPQTQFCRSSESVKRPPEACTCRGDIPSPIRLLSILWQINQEPKQRRAFDIPSTQQYMRVTGVHDFLLISLFSWPTSAPWLDEWTVQDGARLWQ